MIPVILLLVVPAFFVPALSFDCPSPEDVFPCICARKNVFCHNEITTSTDLERAMKSLQGKGRFSLTIRNLNLGNLSLPIFKNLSITEFEITDCKLESIFDTDMKQGYVLGKTLRELRIMNSINDTKGNFRMNIFSLQSLKEIEMTQNVIKNVRSDFFVLTPNTISTLKLSKNRIETIADGAFKKLILLNRLELEENRIQNLSRSWLPDSPYQFWMLVLGNNNISTIPADFFWNMHFLKLLNLQNNKVYEFSERTWSAVWSQLDYLAASGNPIICDSRIDWMFKMRGPRTLSAHCDSPPQRRYTSLQKLIDANRNRRIKSKLEQAKFWYMLLQGKNQVFHL